ncbi:bifunctional nuclease family protein [Anthocerotibacter panamensis]|uniref:bifunctional nuclease family protein n=1 Tax=Anthocerotibacter panamensis TaxID=2857077 RepID=UPI001C40163D|nr:bifunctional nuclease family protein [Anthocerotibacter panamensis]
MAVEMKVAGIALDAVNRSPILVLRDTADRRALPIWIGRAEASAIIQALEGQKTTRPMTHDLFTNFLHSWDFKLVKIVIHSLQDSTFFAVLTVHQGETKKEIDARPSDAVALALRNNTPIWATEEVIAHASMPVDQDADEAEREAFRDFLDKIHPSDFTKEPDLDTPQGSDCS